MGKRLSFFLLCVVIAIDALAANRFIPKKFNTVTSHSDVYPYVLNNAKQQNKKTTTSSNTINSNSSTPIGKRGVIKRTTNARSATTTATPVKSDSNTSARRVIPRNNTVTARAASTSSSPRILTGRSTQNTMVRSTQTTRTRDNNRVQTTTNYSTTNQISSQRCFADYKECMESYCKREDTAYNRCYCSAKLSQIDSRYQNKIDELIQQIIKLQYLSNDSDEEYKKLSSVKTYWDEAVGSYTQTNPWVNIENALNIEWADAQSRVRGQNAFNTGHEYCVQHLRACSYMASNMRDAYKSEITRDCETYEKSLKKIQEAAESVIQNYKN